MRSATYDAALKVLAHLPEEMRRCAVISRGDWFASGPQLKRQLQRVISSQ
jgi:hypothetical protein